LSPDPRLEAVRAILGGGPETVGWGTVELDRAALELGAGGEVTDAPPDELMGAVCRVVRREGERVVLLEPSTEGPLAAFLARFGEGVAVRYLQPGHDAAGRLRESGFALSKASGGPIGRQRLVLGGSRWGPHIIVVEPGAATISP
jgi:hypothetical protein